jgi:hypothetical protein
MKKYLVCSDIHGRSRLLESALAANPDIDTVVIAGDLELDTYDIEGTVRLHSSPKTALIMVKGNCDSYLTSTYALPSYRTFHLGDKHKVLLTHGHLYQARLDIMSYSALENNCDIVIFGHIHKQVDTFEFGIRFLNPGALKNNSYMILTLNDDGDISVEFKG